MKKERDEFYFVHNLFLVTLLACTCNGRSYKRKEKNGHVNLIEFISSAALRNINHSYICRVEWSGVEWSGVEWCGVAWRGVAWHGVQCSAVQCSRVQCSAVQCSGVEWSVV